MTSNGIYIYKRGTIPKFSRLHFRVRILNAYLSMAGSLKHRIFRHTCHTLQRFQAHVFYTTAVSGHVSYTTAVSGKHVIHYSNFRHTCHTLQRFQAHVSYTTAISGPRIIHYSYFRHTCHTLQRFQAHVFYTTAVSATLKVL